MLVCAVVERVVPMSKGTPKKYVWKVVETTRKELNVVAESEHDAIGLFYQATDEGSKIAQVIENLACVDVEAYTIKAKPVRMKRGVYNVS